MRKLFVCALLTLTTSAFATEIETAAYSVDTETSTIDWHLYIEKGTNVYGNISVIEGQFILATPAKAFLKFDLAKTKSWELEDGKKEYSDARDSRIRSITSAEKNVPEVTISSISNYDASKAINEVEFTGKISLNGHTKDLKLKGTLTKIDKGLMPGTNYKLKAEYKLMWKEFKIDNPVIWVLRFKSTPNDYITLKFDLDLKQ